MNKKQREQMEREQSQKKRMKIVIGVGAIVAIVLIVSVILSLSKTRATDEQDVQIALSENGDLHIDKAWATQDVTTLNYGEDTELLLWIDSDGLYRVAFNTCQECYTRGGQYEYENGVITCSACRNQITVSTLQHGSWGGCQPIEFPDNGREDTDTEIVVKAEAFDYASDMFEAWDRGDTETTFEDFSM